jgi:single-stranded DNA-specific DHH superfamily exonuclease
MVIKNAAGLTEKLNHLCKRNPEFGRYVEQFKLDYHQLPNDPSMFQRAQELRQGLLDQLKTQRVGSSQSHEFLRHIIAPIDVQRGSGR